MVFTCIVRFWSTVLLEFVVGYKVSSDSYQLDELSPPALVLSKKFYNASFHTTTIIMNLLSLLLAASLCIGTAANLPTSQFEHFLPGWNPYIQDILRDNCADQYAAYKFGEIPEGANVGRSHLVFPLVDCILNQFPEVRKAELAASAVILGAMPSILQGLGSSYAELAVLGLQRPFLAFLLVAGSPAMQSQKVADFSGLLSAFVDGGQGWRVPRLRWKHIAYRARPLCSLLEHICVGMAVAKVVSLAYQLGIHAVIVFAPDTIFMVPLWTFLAIVIYSVRYLALRRRVRVIFPSDLGASLTRRDSGFPSWTPLEFVPAALQPAKQLEWRRWLIVLVSLMACQHRVLRGILFSGP